MTPTRVALIVLVLLAVVFLVFLWAVEGEDESYDSSDQFQANFKPPSWSRTAFNVLGPFSPRLELQERYFDVPDGSSTELSVSRSSWPFRRAAWVLQRGSRARVFYVAPSSDIEDLREQELDLRPGEDPQSLAVLGSGGQIRISCRGGIDCLVELVD